jgi:hypothetical protein
MVLSCKTQTVGMYNIDINNENVLYNIVFSRGFDHDKIDLYINNTNVLKGVTLTSDDILEITSTWLAIRQEESNIINAFAVTKGKVTINQISLKKSDTIFLKIKFKRNIIAFPFEKSKGKYLIIYNNDGKLEFSQREERPYFD